MSKIALVFPGQGSQSVGMGADIYKAYPAIQQIYDRANEILGFDLAEICFTGPEESLRQTRITQPALFVHSWALYTLLREKGLTGHMAAGHSLGEFSALTAAGVWSFADGLRLVKLRGELMQDAGTHQSGTMAAILGLDFDRVAAICDQVSRQDLVVLANLNSPGQCVISGTVEGVNKAMQKSQEEGAKRVLALNVSGAFHSPLMAPAKERFAGALQTTPAAVPGIPVYSNVSAEPNTDPGILRDLAAQQLVRPVLWTALIERMIADGASEFIEIGAGTVLSGLIRRIHRDAKVTNVSGLEQLEKFIAS